MIKSLLSGIVFEKQNQKNTSIALPKGVIFSRAESKQQIWGHSPIFLSKRVIRGTQPTLIPI